MLKATEWAYTYTIQSTSRVGAPGLYPGLVVLGCQGCRSVGFFLVIAKASDAPCQVSAGLQAVKALLLAKPGDARHGMRKRLLDNLDDEVTHPLAARHYDCNH